MGLFTKRQRPFTVRYEAKSSEGGLDQVLTMANHTEVDVVPVLRYRPLDFYGRELPLVSVTTIQGTSRGQVIVPAGLEVRDLLRFEGPGCRSVRFVDTEVLELVEAEPTGVDKVPVTVMVDLDKQATRDAENFWGIGVQNQTDAEMRVRVTLVELEERHGDNPRQPVDWVSLEGDVVLEPQSHDVVWLPEGVRGRYHDVLGAVAAPPLA